jgi:hypothetical protein
MDYSGFIGVLIGAVIGCYGNYLAAQRSYDLSQKTSKIECAKNKVQHRKQLRDQLRFSYSLLNNEGGFIPVYKMIYDQKWYEHLMYVESEQDRDFIMQWFQGIIMCQIVLAHEYERNIGKTANSPLFCTMLGKVGYMQKISLPVKDLEKISSEIQRIIIELDKQLLC